MNDSRAIIAEAIARVAPDVDVDTLDPDADLRDAAGLDSMDFLNVVVAVHERTGIDIPERDYPRLSTFASFAEYLAAATA
jgi:acyl carrier protein